MRLDTFGICLLLFAVALTTWLGIAGPVYDAFKFNSLGDSAASAAWGQAIVSGVAIGAVYVAATIPVRAEARERIRSERLQAEGMALVLLTEMMAFRGTLERLIDAKILGDCVVQAPTILYRFIDRLYLLGPAAGFFMQMLSGLAANNIIVQDLVKTIRTAEERELAWTNVRSTLELAPKDCDAGISGLNQVLWKRIR
jgi:hypothetical protein